MQHFLRRNKKNLKKYILNMLLNRSGGISPSYPPVDITNLLDLRSEEIEVCHFSKNFI